MTELPCEQAGGAYRMTNNTGTEHCPNCGSGPADVSWATAPSQEVCDTDNCPVNTWDPSVKPVGWYEW